MKTVLEKVSDYTQLTKPRIVLLFGITGLATMVLQGGLLHNPMAFWMVFIGIVLTAGSANALNQYLDRDIDSIMERTRKKRPIPLGKISAQNALYFGVGTGILATFLLVVYGGFLAALLGVGTIFYYVGLYTMWLKRLTPQNIVIGGAAGASAPLIGWAAGSGEISIQAWVLFLIIFMWTPPHFWALALCIKDEYAGVKVPMLPVVRGEEYTRKLIWLYSLSLLPLSLLAAYLSNLGFIYTVPVTLLGIEFLRRAWKLYKTKDEKTAWKLFGFSILYLLALFSFLLADVLLLKPAHAAESKPQEFAGVGITEHLGEQVDLNLKFKNEKGEIVALHSLVNGRQPVALLPVYYGCPNLCSFVINGTIDSFKNLKEKFSWVPGKNFQVIAFSIDPREDEALAADKKEAVLKELKTEEAKTGWHFWVNPIQQKNPDSVENNSANRLAEQIGFGYRFDKQQNQFAHSATMVILTPEGKIARYLYGIEFRATDLKLALVEAGGRKIGSIMDRLILYCFHYDPKTRTYSFYLMNIMRAASVLTVLALGLGFFLLRRREIRRADKTVLAAR